MSAVRILRSAPSVGTPNASPRVVNNNVENLAGIPRIGSAKNPLNTPSDRDGVPVSEDSGTRGIPLDNFSPVSADVDNSRLLIGRLRNLLRASMVAPSPQIEKDIAFLWKLLTLPDGSTVSDSYRHH
jgi:hypothetical protein